MNHVRSNSTGSFLTSKTAIIKIKLTLKLNKEVIGKAKDYAKTNNISLSRLIENYLELLINKQEDSRPISEQVKKLSGIVSLPKDCDYREDYRDHLANKYK